MFVNRKYVAHNAALQRLAHATTDKGRSPASPLHGVGLRVDGLHNPKHFGSWHTEDLGCVMRDYFQFGNLVFASMKDNINGHALGGVSDGICQDRLRLQRCETSFHRQQRLT
jgi:hypothetical protein